MDLDQLKRILELVREHEISEFEVEQDGLRLKIRKDAAGAVVAMPAPAAPLPVVVAAGGAAGPPAPPGAPAVTHAEAADSEIELAVVKSPIVGTFYRAPEPGTPA